MVRNRGALLQEIFACVEVTAVYIIILNYISLISPHVMFFFLSYKDEQIKQLTTRIENIEKINEFKANQEAVQKAQMEMLTTLRNIRESIATGENADNIHDSKELAKLKEENENLKAINSKQAYRINHLVSNMEKLIEK